MGRKNKQHGGVFDPSDVTPSDVFKRRKMAKVTPISVPIRKPKKIVKKVPDIVGPPVSAKKAVGVQHKKGDLHYPKRKARQVRAPKGVSVQR